MFRPEKIREELLKIIEGIRNPPSIMNFIPALRYTRARFDELIEKCLALHQSLENVMPGDDTWLHTQELFNIEAEYKRLRAKLLLLPSVLLTYIVFIIMFGTFRFIDISGFVKSVLKVDAPERLITFGISGAFLYLATYILSELNGENHSKESLNKVADFAVRVLLAIVVPIVLVSLFFTPEGGFNTVRLTPEILAFACGYSAKLVVDLFNKIVEKCSKMIEAI